MCIWGQSVAVLIASVCMFCFVFTHFPEVYSVKNNATLNSLSDLDLTRNADETKRSHTSAQDKRQIIQFCVYNQLQSPHQ